MTRPREVTSAYTRSSKRARGRTPDPQASETSCCVLTTKDPRVRISDHQGIHIYISNAFIHNMHRLIGCNCAPMHVHVLDPLTCQPSGRHVWCQGQIHNSFGARLEERLRQSAAWNRFALFCGCGLCRTSRVSEECADPSGKVCGKQHKLQDCTAVHFTTIDKSIS